MNWLEPWQPIADESVNDNLVRELGRELCHEHVLFGIPVAAIGSRFDCDDVLFQFMDGTNRFAVVHLTYARHPEHDPIWPEARLFDSWEQFELDEMKPAHEEWQS